MPWVLKLAASSSRLVGSNRLRGLVADSASAVMGTLRFLGCVASAIFCRYEIPLSSIHGEKICDHLASYRKCRSIGIPFLFLSFIEQGKIVILSGRQLRRLDQHALDILVALFGNRCANRLLG